MGCGEVPSRGDDSIRALALLLVLSGAPVSALAVDVQIIGTRLSLSASANSTQPRKVSFRALDNVIVAPLPDPSSGASLRVFASNAAGQCHATIDLPSGNWSALGGDGPGRGWRYRDSSAGSFGIRSIVVRPGKILVRGRGVEFPCGLEADQQTVPVSVVLRMGGMRYCATFGGDVHTNKPQHFRATNAAPPAVCPDTADVTVATLNILHGLGCGADFCRQEERVILAGQFVVERGCPDVVALQEVINIGEPSVVTAVQNHLLDICPFPYQVVYLGGNNIDDSLLLTRYPPIATELRFLKNNFRNVLFARIDHPAGAADVFSTHLASGSDGGPNPCGANCPPECVAAGAVTLRDCQAVQTALMVEERHDIATPAVLLGDFNSPPGSFVYDQFVDRGWTDAYLAAGNPECDSGTGIGCTSGREDGALTDLESPVLNVNERIDYAFLVPAGAGSSCIGALDSGADADGDGTATRLFADVPNPFAPTCGPAPDPVCWASDHDGVQADINCE
jgi:endonuclease/exonuclease/phosphatase family metal-dependent hydrolase